MKCPICEAPMKEGEVNLKKSILNMLALGWGATNLVFKGTDDKKEVELMTSWDFSKAYYCKKCGASLIASDKGQSGATQPGCVRIDHAYRNHVASYQRLLLVGTLV